MFLKKKVFAWKTAQGDPNFAALFFRQFSPKQPFFENFEIVFCAYGGCKYFLGAVSVSVDVLVPKEGPTKNLGRLIKF